MAQEVIEHCWAPNEEEIFDGLYWDNYLQAVAKVGRYTLHCIDLEPYPQTLLKSGLKIRVNSDPEGNQTVDQVMEYTGAVRVMILEQVA